MGRSAATKSKTVEHYLALPYRIVLTPDTDDSGREAFVAEVAELPGCLGQGQTADEAVAMVRDAMAGWISVALDDDLAIPEPGSEDRYSGKFLLRLPKGLHAALARAAEAEGVSLNQFSVGALAGAIAWRPAGGGASPMADTAQRFEEETRARHGAGKAIVASRHRS